MKELPAIFQNGEQVYAVDTCEPLKAAVLRDEVQLHAWGHALYPGILLPRTFLPAVRSVGVWDAPTRQSWGLDRHCNEGIEFTYLERGKTVFEVDGKPCMLRKEHLTITRPWQFHRVGDPHIGSCRLVWLILDVNVRRPNQTWQWPEWLLCSPEDLRLLTRLLSHNEQPVWRANDEVAQWFGKLGLLLEEIPSPEAGETKLKFYINALLIALMEMLERERIPLDDYLSSSQRAVQAFLHALPQHAASDWNLAAMASQCGLSRSQFSDYCKELTGTTPMQYLTQCRIDLAAKLLTGRPELSITDVAYQCGFNSSQYFATVFRAAKACSPRAFVAQPQAVVHTSPER